MKITFINGSPKQKFSTSKKIIDQISELLDIKATTLHLTNHITCDEIDKLNDMDALIIVFPLYFDGIPGHLIESLQSMELYFKNKTLTTKIYVVINAGFYEGQQCINAMNLMKNWVKRANLVWGMGLGIGAGTMLARLESIPLGQGPRKAYGKALLKLTNAIKNLHRLDDMFVSPNFIKRLYILMVHRGWYKMSKKNSNNKKDLYQSNY